VIVLLTVGGPIVDDHCLVVQWVNRVRGDCFVDRWWTDCWRSHFSSAVRGLAHGHAG